MGKTAAVLCLVTLAATVSGQSAAVPQGGERPRFEAASVKPNTSADAGMNNRFSPGRFSYVNTPLSVLISLAYGMNADRVLGVPDWARTAKFDITATYNPELRQYQSQMLQRLLEERFALQVHREKRELPVYEAVIARADGQLGPAMRAATLDCSPSNTANRVLCGTRIATGLVQGKSVNWRVVLDQLPSEVGRPVIDRTGLTGMFEVTLEWTPDPAAMPSPDAAARAAAAAAAAGDRAVTIFTALQEQLGIRLQPARAPLDVLVVDRVERPTPD